MIQILKSPNKTLNQKSTDSNLKDAKDIILKLKEVTKKVDHPFNFWLGMAAPQVGANKRIFILRRKHKSYQEFINPEIIKKKFLLPTISKCYSVKGIVFLNRYYFIKVKYLNQDNEEVIKNFFGPKAFVIQHEIDHLNGRLIK